MDNPYGRQEGDDLPRQPRLAYVEIGISRIGLIGSIIVA